jgi:hypothetical protein
MPKEPYVDWREVAVLFTLMVVGTIMVFAC